MKRMCLLFCLMCLGLFAMSCGEEKVTPIDINAIASIEIFESSDNLLVLECDATKAGKFVAAYNDASLYTNDVGTTHPLYAKVTLTNGRMMEVWGGSQDFLTVLDYDGVQFNIASKSLDSWFYGLE